MSHHKTELIEVYYSYPDGKKAINGISVEIGHGESVGIVGANGAGKSTLLQLLIGVINCSSGIVRIGEVTLTKKTIASIRERIGYVFQNSDDQLFTNSVYDDVAFGPRNLGLDESEVEEKVINALRFSGIENLKDRAPYKLSGGEKKSAAIATVLSMSPDILIMDEPSVALDPKSRRNLINILKNFKHTKIIASHDLDMIYAVCERVIVISEGKVIKDGKMNEVLSDEKIMEDSNLEVPLSIKIENLK